MMFDNISFMTHTNNVVFADISHRESYRQFLLDNQLPENDSQEYRIDSSSQYLLARPMLPERKAALAHIQAFCYLESGPLYYTKRDDFDSYLLIYTYQGEGILEYEGKQYLLHPGDGFFIDCRRPHYYRTKGTHWNHGDLHISGGSIDYLYQEFFRLGTPLFRPLHPHSFQSVLENALRAHQSVEPAGDFTVSVLIYDLLKIVYEGRIPSARETIPENILALQQYIDQHYTEDLSIEALSQIAYLSKYHLIRQFRKHTGYSPHEYIVNLRVSQAESMLRMTKLPAYKIGMLVGFSTEANFISHFKRIYGITPGQVRGNQSRKP